MFRCNCSQAPHPESRRLAYLHAPNGSALGVRSVWFTSVYYYIVRQPGVYALQGTHMGRLRTITYAVCYKNRGPSERLPLNIRKWI